MLLIFNFIFGVIFGMLFYHAFFGMLKLTKLAIYGMIKGTGILIQLPYRLTKYILACRRYKKSNERHERLYGNNN